jgi:ParB family chromosome partitioning protein
MADKKRGLGKGFTALVDASRARAVAAPAGKEPIILVAVERIHPNPYQPRQRFDDVALQTLAASIQRDGILQPLAVRRSPATPGDYELIAGERRLRAAKLAGLAEVPCLLLDADDQGMGLLSLVENLLREELNVLDEGEAYQQLVDTFSLTQEQIAERVGRSRPHVTNTIRLLSLPELVRAYIATGELTAGHGRALLALDTDDDKIALAQEVLARKLSVRETENLVKRAAQVLKRMRAGQTPKETPPHPYAHLAEEMKVRFGTKVRFTGGKTRGTIELHYFSEEELTRLTDLLLR